MGLQVRSLAAGPGAAPGAGASVGGPTDFESMMFEDIMSIDPSEFQGPGDDEDEDMLLPGQQQKQRKKSEPRPKLPAPYTDEDLERRVDPLKLPRNELIWAMGRASTLELRSERLWKGFGKAIAKIGETKFEPAELCRIMQAYAYTPSDVFIDSKQLQRILKAFAARIEQYNDERLMRMVYGYTKTAAKRGLPLQRFLDFASSEVVQRNKMEAWRKLWILRSVSPLPGVSEEFKMMLVSAVMRGAGGLDAESWHHFIPMLVQHKIHERPNVVGTLNKHYKSKIFNYTTPDFLLRSGEPMVFFDLLKSSTLALWLCRLHELRLPLTVEMAGAAAPLPKLTQRRAGLGRSGRRPSLTVVSERALAKRATENLETLKRIECCLRLERDPTVISYLPQSARHLLTVARSTPLEPPEGYPLLERPFVFGDLSVLLDELGVPFTSTIHGPYHLQLARPESKLVVEWDTNWVLYPPWRRNAQEDYTRRKHKHLRAEGWQVVTLPLAEFQALKTKEDQLDWVKRAIESFDLAAPKTAPAAPDAPGR